MSKIKKNKYTVAVIGCGKVGVLYSAEKGRPISSSHAGATASNKKTDLIALVDTNKKALTRAGKLFSNTRLYASADECIKKENPDIVVIATPPSVRLQLIKLCIQNNIRVVICEKPLANNVREARAIKSAVEKSNTTFLLNYQRRFSSLFEQTRLAISSGSLGRIQQVTCYYSNGLYNNGGHALDALMHILGESAVVCWAKANKNIAHPAGDYCIDAVLETKSGIRIVLQSIDQSDYGIFDIRILGTRGEYALLDYGSTLVKTSAKVSIFKDVRQLDRVHTVVSHGEPVSVLDIAIKCLNNNKRPASGTDNGLAVMEVLEKIKLYAQKNK